MSVWHSIRPGRWSAAAVGKASGRRHWAGPWVLALAMVATPATFAADAPRVGLVLGGGGARGVAHLGVLQVLEELRIPIHCIAGTSMGALVGGVYASGLPLAEMERQLGAIDWDRIFSDDPPRSEKPFRAKRDDYHDLFRLELGQRGTELLVPSGTTAGYKFEFVLREMVQQAGNFAAQDFDTLPIPYRALATNIEDGTSQVLASGDLVKAMRASMSVPGAIAPVEIDGVLYVDGGLLQNVPVAAAREACADVVIAVDVGGELLPREELRSAIGISRQMINVFMAQNVRASIDSLGAADVLIRPALGSFSSANFAEAMPLIDKGVTAARAQAERLRAYSVSAEAYAAWQAAVRARLPKVPSVTEVRVATTENSVNPQVLEQELAAVPGVDLKRRPETDFSLANLNERLTQVYGRGDFERMDYRMIDRPGGRTVEVQGVEKSWGPNYVKFGLGLATDQDQNRFSASVSHRMTWLNSAGAEWRTDAQIGFRDRLVSEIYQPVSLRSGAFVAGRIDLQQEPIIYFIGGSRFGDFRVRHARAHLDLGLQNKYGELRLGAFTGHLDAEVDLGVIPWPDYDLRQTGYTGRAIYDQVDNPQLIRDGLLARLETFGTVAGWGSEDAYNKTSITVVGARKFGRHSLQLAGHHGDTLQGNLPLYDPFLLGGFLRGSGYRMDELLGQEVSLVRGVYSYQLTALPAPLGRGVYAGGSLEQTRAVLGNEAADRGRTRPSGALFVAADTFLGPAFLAWGRSFADGGDSTLYLLLGGGP